MKLDKTFDGFAENLMEFEKTWETRRGVHSLRNAVEIRQELVESELGSESITRFHNLSIRYGLSCEDKAKAIFDSSEIESNQFLNFDFLKILEYIKILFEEAQVFGNNEGEYLRSHLYMLIFILLAQELPGASNWSVDDVRDIVLKT